MYTNLPIHTWTKKTAKIIKHITSEFSPVKPFLPINGLILDYKKKTAVVVLYSSSSFLTFLFLLLIFLKSITISSSLESVLVLFCSFFVWDNAAPKAIPMPKPIPKLSVAAPIAVPINNPAKNFNFPSNLK